MIVLIAALTREAVSMNGAAVGTPDSSPSNEAT
jgi:hypothetical protein